ncbi:DNA ligase [Helicobacter typhlonius]|uniref:DNA ligase n=1 Tax=Helicobacter typhlonius TaxID=76936 RepID=UPI002FE2CF95
MRLFSVFGLSHLAFRFYFYFMRPYFALKSCFYLTSPMQTLIQKLKNILVAIPHVFLCVLLPCTLNSHLFAKAYEPLLLSDFAPYADKLDLSQPAQWLVSEKLDGVRGLWDGERMHFRSGKTMPLPQAFSANFPPFALDGELYSPHLHFNEIISILKNPARQDEITELKYYVFDVPFASGGLMERLNILKQYLESHPHNFIEIIPQTPLESLDSVYTRLESITQNGGEGLVIRSALAPYESKRSKNAFKLKKSKDAECEVVAHTEGKGKYSGMLGALVCRYNGTSFKIGSGLSDETRRNPPKIGTIITFKYQSLTPRGIPRFPVFWRIKEGE